MGFRKLLIPITVCVMFSFACAYIVVPTDLLVTPTSVMSKGWSGTVTNVSQTAGGDLHIDLAITNNTQDWSVMQADEGKPAYLVTSDGKRSACDTVFVGTGKNSLAPGFRMRGYTGGTKFDPKIQLLYVECKGATLSPGSQLSISYNYVTGPYDLHVPSVPSNATMVMNLDEVVKDVNYPVGTPVEGLLEKLGDKIEAINNFTLTLTDVIRTDSGLELHWEDFNPSDYPNYVHIGVPPVIGDDGIIYGRYEDPSIAEPTIALQKSTGVWTTTVTVPADVKGLYVLVSVEIRQSMYFISHVIDITDR